MSTNTSEPQSDSNIENKILSYLKDVSRELEKLLCNQKNGYEFHKKPITVNFSDKAPVIGSFQRSVKPLDGVSPVFLDSEFLKNDDGFLLIECIINQLGMAILKNSNQPSNNGEYTFYSEYNEKLNSKQAAAAIYSNATELLSEITEELLIISFNDIDLLSSTYYESKKATGVLLFAASENDGLEKLPNMCVWTVESKDITFEKKNIKYIRKLLVGGGESGLLFVTNSTDFPPFFLGAVREKFAASFPIRIDILGPLRWKISINGREAFRKEINSIVLNTEINEDDIISAVESEFDKTIDTKQLSALINPIFLSKHGAAVILIDGSDSDGAVHKWLSDLKEFNKATNLAASDNLKEDYLDKASAMDGAIVIDISGPKVIAIAAIVSEKACTVGDPGRGSRYNSLQNFAQFLSNEEKPVVALVFSEDGDKYIFAGKNLREKKAT